MNPVAPAVLYLMTLTAAHAAAPVCPGTRLALDTSIGGTPIARLTLGGHTGNVLLDTGATGSAVDAATFGVAPGTSLTLAKDETFRAEDMRNYAAPPGGQMARFGTDLMSRRVIEFHYEASRPFAVIGATPCPAKSARAAGLKNLGVPRTYAASAKDHDPSLPNVPAIRLALAGLTVPAQIDTGFDDNIDPGIIQGNAALLAALRAAHVSLTPEPGKATLGCAANRVNERWRIANGPLLEIKADAACGGIARFSKPWAQLGASWLKRWRIIIFDGLGEQIWVRS